MQRVFVVGDSISIQYGPYLERMLAGRFAYARKTGEEEALADLDIPRGANGGDSSMVRAYLEGLRAGGGFETDILLLNAGLHDIKWIVKTEALQVPPADYEPNLRAIVEAGRALASTVVWIMTTDTVDEIHNADPNRDFYRYRKDLLALNAVAERVMAELGVPVIDLYTFTKGLGEPAAIFCDHVHFTEPVRAQQAAYIAGWLEGRMSR